MKLRHFLYDLTDVLLLHITLNIPSYVVELLPVTPIGASSSTCWESPWPSFSSFSAWFAVKS